LERAEEGGEIVTVFAASSLQDLVSDISTEWGKRAGGSVRAQFAATSDLARQIQEGAEADVFLTAAPEWLDKLPLLERMDWLSNRLVLVAASAAADPDLHKLESLAMANEQVPAGKYARAALTYMHVNPPDRLIYGANVRDVLSKVAEGGAQTGIVYATDAAIDPRVRIALTFPAESHPPIRYTAGLLHERGRDIFAALREPWVREIAMRQGFLPIEK
jgi:molybdate transport system substrate-binding protein